MPSTAEYGKQVYGDVNSQQTTQGNLVKMNYVSNGGKRKSKRSTKRGGNILTDIAVPAVFIAANSLYKSRKSNKMKSSRPFVRKTSKRFSRRQNSRRFRR